MIFILYSQHGLAVSSLWCCCPSPWTQLRSGRSSPLCGPFPGPELPGQWSLRHRVGEGSPYSLHSPGLGFQRFPLARGILHLGSGTDSTLPRRGRSCGVSCAGSPLQHQPQACSSVSALFQRGPRAPPAPGAPLPSAGFGLRCALRLIVLPGPRALRAGPCMFRQHRVHSSWGHHFLSLGLGHQQERGLQVACAGPLGPRPQLARGCGLG